jgi:hypothetical protein
MLDALALQHFNDQLLLGSWFNGKQGRGRHGPR